MEPFYLSHDEFWDWFNRDPTLDAQISGVTKQFQGLTRTRPVSKSNSNQSLQSATGSQYDQTDSCEVPSASKKMKTGEPTKIRHISETLASERCDKRYIVMYGRHRPGKKNKIWEGDGYLTLLNGVAHLCDLKGKMVEEPTVLDEVDLQMIRDESDIIIGNTEVQIVEADTR